MSSLPEPTEELEQTNTLHLDVDAFFASVEQLVIPRLRGRPVAVGNGVIASCSYEARRYGLKAGMPLWQARKLCPGLVCLDGQYSIYKCFAEQIWQVARRYTVGLETYLDEAYGDIAGLESLYGRPIELGQKLRQAVLSEVGLSVSVGLASNRMLAKLASQSAKPAGVAWIESGRAEAFLTDLPIGKLLGVGHKTEQILGNLNIQTIGQLRQLTRETLRAMLGERGEVLYERCRGRDVQAPPEPEARKLPRSISRETTFHQSQCDSQAIRAMLAYLLERAMRMVRQHGLLTRAVELTVRYEDWKQLAGRTTLPHGTEIDGEMFFAVCGLLDRLHTRRVALRHVGIVLSNFAPADHTPTLFDDQQETRARHLHEAVDRIRDRWGHSAVVKGDSIDLLGKLRQNENGFVLRTPSLTK